MEEKEKKIRIRQFSNKGKEQISKMESKLEGKRREIKNGGRSREEADHRQKIKRGKREEEMENLRKGKG